MQGCIGNESEEPVQCQEAVALALTHSPKTTGVQEVSAPRTAAMSPHGEWHDAVPATSPEGKR